MNKIILKLNQLQHSELWQGAGSEDIILKSHKTYPGPIFTCNGRKSGAAGRFLSCNTTLCKDSGQSTELHDHMSHRHSHPVPLLEPVLCHYLDYFPPGPLHSLTASVIFEIWGKSLCDFAAAILGTDATRQIGHVSAPSLLSSAGQVSYLTPSGKIRHGKTRWTMNWCSWGTASPFRHHCSGRHPLIQEQNLLTVTS